MSTDVKADIKQKQVEKADKRLKSEPNAVMSVVLTILKETAEFKGWELIFQSLMYGFLLWGAYNASIIFEYHNAPQYAHIDKASIYDFKFALIMVIFFQLYKMLCYRLFYKVLYDNLDPVKFPTHEDRDKRTYYQTIWVSNIIYYTCSTIAAYVLFHESDFWPSMLGGSAKPGASFGRLPNFDNFEHGTTFYMVQFGCHLHTLIDYCVHKWRDPKFWEMFLHHILAVQLIFFSYMANIHRAGILVLFVHDPCDVFLCLNRIINDSKRKNMAVQGGVYAFFSGSWVFFRLFAFPKCVTSPCLEYAFSGVAENMAPIFFFLGLMLSALVILHLYWFIFILRIAVIMATSKKEYNVYDNKSKKKDE